MGTIFYKYKKIDDFLKDSLERSYFYYSSPLELNDPFELSIITEIDGSDEEILAWIRKNNPDKRKESKIFQEIKKGTLQGYINSNIDVMRKRYFLLCLSKVWDESQLWGLYADSNKGICIGYNMLYNPISYLVQLDLKNEPNTSFRKYGDSYIENLFEVMYSDEKFEPYNPIKKNDDAINKGFLKKQKKWENEQEYRSILFSEGSKPFNQKILYKKNILKEIIFGNRTKLDDMKEIYKIVKTNYVRDIKYFQIVINNVTKKLERCPIVESDLI